jgi:uncharacterized membrane protein (DUF373 family)
MCSSYQINYLNFLFPLDILSSVTKLCISFDITYLVIVIFVRLCLYIFIYYIAKSYIKHINKDFYSVLSWILIIIIFLNCFSLIIVIGKIPQIKY